MKKFILFIVEANNDRREIEAMLHTPYFDQYKEQYKIEFLTKGGDVTATTGVKATNIQKKLEDIVLYFRKNGVPFSNIKVQDIQEIVQIVDLDGTFVSNDHIVRSNNSKFYYTDTAIVTSNVDGAIGRNKKKAEILEKLISVKQIGNIPYSLYFMSCNMDHVLFDTRMPPQGEKNSNSIQFQLKCQNNPSILLESIFKDGVKADKPYNESWEEMKKDCKSLQRKTNFNLFFGEKAKNYK